MFERFFILIAYLIMPYSLYSSPIDQQYEQNIQTALRDSLKDTQEDTQADRDVRIQIEQALQKSLESIAQDDDMGFQQDLAKALSESVPAPDQLARQALRAFDLSQLEPKNLMDKDVHNYNRYINGYTEKYMELIREILKPGAPLDISTSFSKLEAHFGSLGAIPQALSSNVKKLKEHVITNNRNFESETNIYVHSILSEIVTYLDKVQEIYGIEPYQSFVFDLSMTLEDNLGTKGGCFPGFAGRLFAFYEKLTRDLCGI